MGQMKIFHLIGCPSLPGVAPGVAPRIVVFVLLESWDAIPRMEFRIPRMEVQIPRAALRIPWNPPRPPRMAFSLRDLDGRNRARVIAESLARVIAAIRITSVRWWSYLPPKNTEIGRQRPCVRCAAIRIARLAFIRLTFVPHGIAEWTARVDSVR